MLTILNNYAHGFVAVPVIVACREAGLFDLLAERGPLTTSQLLTQLSEMGHQPKRGHLQVALNLLHSLGWLQLDGVGGHYRLTAAAEQQQRVPSDLLQMLSFPMVDYLTGATPALSLRRWFAQAADGWHCDDADLRQYLDGLLAMPLLIALKDPATFASSDLRGLDGSPLDSAEQLAQIPLADKLAALNLVARAEVTGFLRGQDWLQDDKLDWNAAGDFIQRRIYVTAIAFSYAPMLDQIDTMLFGLANPAITQSGDSVGEHDVDGHEQHVDRTLNVIASGFNHQKYFADLEAAVLALFNQPPFEQQPSVIADMGCGDGSLLQAIYDVVRHKSARGQVLDQYPLTLVGVDVNQKALEATAATLADYPHRVMYGDIGDPQRLLQDLQQQGIERDQLLHVRSFLDHDRPFIEPADSSRAQQRQVASDMVCVDRDGGQLANGVVIQSLVEHFQRWGQILGRHGLLLLEVHRQDVATVQQWTAKTESLHFDAYHAFSRQMLVDAPQFYLALAEAGLFSSLQNYRKYPKTLPLARITLDQIQHRDYQVRLATPSDLPRLLELEQCCWPAGLRTDEKTLSQRLQQPQHWPLVLQAETQVQAVIYSQRIDSAETIVGRTMHDVDQLACDDGSCLQLLAVNVDPAVQDRGYGDQLLDFRLQLASLTPQIKQIVGITRCKDFARHQIAAASGETLVETLVETPAETLSETLAVYRDYLERRTQRGKYLDPVLRFHAAHGASIGEPLAAYRPGDQDNQGFGVWVHYDVYPLRRPQLHQQEAVSASEDTEVAEDQATEPMPSESRSISPSAELTTSRQHSASDIHQLVTSQIQRLLLSDAALDSQQPLMELGLDSADLLELNDSLSETFATELGPLFFFDCNTADKIERELCRRFADSASDSATNNLATKVTTAGVTAAAAAQASQAPQAPVPATAVSAAHEREALAIVGMACCLPGGVNSPEQLWQLLQQQRSAISELPAGRFAWPDSVDLDGRQRGLQYAGLIDGIEQFDAGFFRLSRAEAETMDPQQRWLLMLSWQCLEDAAIDPDSLRGSRTGVYIGASGSDYRALWQAAVDQGDLDLPGHFGSATSMAALPNRLSYFYDWHGPSVHLDSACSSSLVALHEAAKAIHYGDCDQALVGAIHLICHSANSLAYQRAGMLAADGRCKTFADNADGYVRGEGGLMLLLKPQSRAEADGDRIEALLLGSASNHGGQASGLTVPNPAQQAQLVVDAYRNAAIEASSVGFIEAHGTGTALGDPIEVQALQQAFAKLTVDSSAENHRCALGSIKTNIGHLEAAAGLAGLFKLVLSLQRGRIPASLHCQTLNTHIDVQRGPFFMVDCEQDWPQSDGPRRASLSSFGSGGANAHVVLQQAPGTTAEFIPASSDSTAQAPVYLLVLSAKTANGLRQRGEQLLQWLADNPEPDWYDLSASLLLGRQAMPLALAWLVQPAQRDAHDLCCQQLQQLLALEAEPTSVLSQPGFARWRLPPESPNQGVCESGPQHSGQANSVAGASDALMQQLGQSLLAQLPAYDDIEMYREKLLALAELYVQGQRLDWAQLFTSRRARRLRLPVYPFDCQAYWLPTPQSSAASVAVGSSAGLAKPHPLEAHRSELPGGKLAPVDLTQPLSLVPSWQPFTPSTSTTLAGPTLPQRSLLVTDAAWLANQTLTEQWPHCLSLQQLANGQLTGQLPTLDQIERVVCWLPPIASAPQVFDRGPAIRGPAIRGLAITENAFDSKQLATGLLQLVQALLARGAGKRPLQWTLWLPELAPLEQMEKQTWPASVLLGLFSTLRLEQPQWSVQLLDPGFVLDPCDSLSGWLQQAAHLPADSQGQLWARREASWYRQQWCPPSPSPSSSVLPGALPQELSSSLAAPSPYRQGGVYVLIGGAGRVGRSISEYLLREQQAQLVWIGRRPLDDEIAQQQQQLAQYGPKPVYLSADASNHEALEQVYQQIKQRFWHIHGVFQLSMTMAGRHLASLSGSELQAVLDSKLAVAQQLLAVFDAEALDFALFLSSINSLMPTAGQGAYASACSAHDYLAQQMAAGHWQQRLKVLNLGYFGDEQTLNSVDKAGLRSWLQRHGHATLNADELNQAIKQCLLAATTQQMTLKLRSLAPLQQLLPSEATEHTLARADKPQPLLDRQRLAQGFAELGRQSQSALAELALLT